MREKEKVEAHRELTRFSLIALYWKAHERLHLNMTNLWFSMNSLNGIYCRLNSKLTLGLQHYKLCVLKP